LTLKFKPFFNTKTKLVCGRVDGILKRRIIKKYYVFLGWEYFAYYIFYLLLFISYYFLS
jgi:hypothetical protein